MISESKRAEIGYFFGFFVLGAGLKFKARFLPNN